MAVGGFHDVQLGVILWEQPEYSLAKVPLLCSLHLNTALSSTLQVAPLSAPLTN